MRRKSRAIRALCATIGLWVAGRLAAHFVALPSMPVTPRALTRNAAPATKTTTPKKVRQRGSSITILLDPPIKQKPKTAPIPSSPSRNDAVGLPSPSINDVPRTDPPERLSHPRHAPPLHGSGWILIRPDRTRREIAPLGQLGASQMGARLLVPMEQLLEGLSLSFRLSASPSLIHNREAALGLELARPLRLPFAVLLEARLPAKAHTPPRPALILIGGLYDQPVTHRVIAEGYAQAGIVGLKHSLLFADGHLTLATPLGSSSHAPRLGVGIWGGAQPGIARVDVGPSLIFPSQSFRLSLDWRFRTAGTARPYSGPSLTLGKDF